MYFIVKFYWNIFVWKMFNKLRGKIICHFMRHYWLMRGTFVCTINACLEHWSIWICKECMWKMYYMVFTPKSTLNQWFWNFFIRIWDSLFQRLLFSFDKHTAQVCSQLINTQLKLFTVDKHTAQVVHSW